LAQVLRSTSETVCMQEETVSPKEENDLVAELKKSTPQPEVLQAQINVLLNSVGTKTFQSEVLKAELLQDNQKLFNLHKQLEQSKKVHGQKKEVSQ
jgi:hypothetical protein